jgi:hypothetical protein
MRVWARPSPQGCRAPRGSDRWRLHVHWRVAPRPPRATPGAGPRTGARRGGHRSDSPAPHRLQPAAARPQRHPGNVPADPLTRLWERWDRTSGPCWSSRPGIPPSVSGELAEALTAATSQTLTSTTWYVHDLLGNAADIETPRRQAEEDYQRLRSCSQSCARRSSGRESTLPTGSVCIVPERADACSPSADARTDQRAMPPTRRPSTLDAPGSLDLLALF